ncbi:MAG: RNA polymerase sigma factor [Chitinophagales bacterium]
MSANTLQNELNLLKRIAEGDEQAFKLIFELYHKKIFGAAIKMTHSVDVAEEIVQEIFVTLWIKRSCLAFAQVPSSYLFSIAYNCIFAHLKKMACEKTARRYALQGSLDGERSSEEWFNAKETRETLEKIINHLPPRQQIIFRLSKQEDLSRNEIARRLNISPNTVRNHLQEAIKFIRLKFYK